MSQKPSPPPRDEFETIAPAEVRLASARRSPEDAEAGADAGAASGRGAPGSRRLPPRGALLALAALSVAAIVVFVLLPEPTPTAVSPAPPASGPGERPERPESAAPAPDAGGADVADVVPPFEQLRLQRERAAAQEVLERLLSLSESLEARAVERWGAERHAQARALAEAGDELFLARDYEAAQARYRQAVTTLEALTAEVDVILETQLQRGAEALLDGDSEQAREAFDLAAAVDPGNRDAAAGLERAGVLDEVLGLLRDARDVARDGALTAARGLIDDALALDPDSTQAQEAAREIDQRLRAAAFTRAMSDGYTALRDGRFEAARDEFRRARTLGDAGDDAAEVEEALRLTDARALAARIEALRRDAERLVAEEQWTQAAARFAAALELDATLAFAREGNARAQRRARLDAELEEALAATAQFSDEAERVAARALLERAEAVSSPGPRLEAQTAALSEALSVAAVPVPVTFVSDGATNITLLRVERLGTLERRVLELHPGAYVATGSRRGYRDVRVEFLVTGNGTEAPVDIRCETRI